MYNVTFEADNGQRYIFGVNGRTVFDMDLGNGVSVNIGSAQGFGQIGESVQTQSVSGRNITVRGVCYGDVPTQKKTLRRVFAPFTAGRLVFEGKYYIRVVVKDPPSFSSVKLDGRFTMRLFAPYPFFKLINGRSEELGAIRPLFSFPVNYATPHSFGERIDSHAKNIYNDSDVSVPFSLSVSIVGASSNIVVANLRNFQTLTILGNFSFGDRIELYRTDDNVLRAELTHDGDVSDILYRIDENSNLFELVVGDNLISVTDDQGGAGLSARISYNPVVVAVYED